MNRRSTNMRLLVILGVLIAAIMVLVMTGENNTRVAVSNENFAVTDTSALTGITLYQPDDTVRLQQGQSGWTVDGRYAMDGNLKNVLFSLLSQVSVQRAVAGSQAPEIMERLDSAGVLVEVNRANGNTSRFLTGGNATQTLSYFSRPDEENAYVVYIPGYDSYVSGLFTIPAQDWRNKTLLNAGPRDLQRMQVTYPGEPEKNFQVVVGDNFVTVPGAEPLDTTAMFNYLQRATFFEADNYVKKGEDAAYDSLAKTEPYAILELFTLAASEPQRLKLYYRLPGDGFFLGENSQGELVRIQARRLVPVLREKQFFVKDR